MSEQNSDSKRRIEPWAVIPAVFFLVLIGAYLISVGSVISTDASSVEVNAYQRGAEFDQDRAAERHFEQAGLALLSTGLGEPGQVQLRLTGEAAQRLTAVRLHFYRASSSSLDQTLDWDAPGESLAIGLPRAGAWRVTVVGELDGEAVRVAQLLNL
ncbi:MAG: FixH family protein [Planctomycetota bacterium]|jgi:nitrogen fixation protein FixH|nr:FixH family protein [Planctomycetota bacterium]